MAKSTMKYWFMKGHVWNNNNYFSYFFYFILPLHLIFFNYIHSTSINQVFKGNTFYISFHLNTHLSKHVYSPHVIIIHTDDVIKVRKIRSSYLLRKRKKKKIKLTNNKLSSKLNFFCSVFIFDHFQLFWNYCIKPFWSVASQSRKNGTWIVKFIINSPHETYILVKIGKN